MSRHKNTLDPAAIAAEMRQIFPQRDSSANNSMRDIRAQNQARFDAAQRTRPRPSRVS